MLCRLRKSHMLRTVRKTALAPQALFIDGTMDVPVVQQRSSPPRSANYPGDVL